MRKWGHTIFGNWLYICLMSLAGLDVFKPIFSITFLHEPEEVALFMLPMMLINLGGSLYPDVDLLIMRVWPSFGHRNPLTHSALLPLILVFSALKLRGSAAFRFVVPFLTSFLIGVGSHLIGDLVKTANIVGVPARIENFWHTINAAFCLVWVLSPVFTLIA